MRVKEKRVVEVKYCDFCEEETNNLNQCAVCKREMCSKEGGAVHSAFDIDLYRHADGRRLISHVCKECATAKFTGVIHEFFDGMMSEDPVREIPGQSLM